MMPTNTELFLQVIKDNLAVKLYVLLFKCDNSVYFHSFKRVFTARWQTLVFKFPPTLFMARLSLSLVP